MAQRNVTAPTEPAKVATPTEHAAANSSDTERTKRGILRDDQPAVNIPDIAPGDGMAVLKQYECDELRFAGDPNASYDRHSGVRS